MMFSQSVEPLKALFMRMFHRFHRFAGYCDTHIRPCGCVGVGASASVSFLFFYCDCGRIGKDRVGEVNIGGVSQCFLKR